MKGSDCVKSSGKLVLNLFPEGYFLESENTFTAGISRHQLDAIFGKVCSLNVVSKLQINWLIFLSQKLCPASLRKLNGVDISITNHLQKN